MWAGCSNECLIMFGRFDPSSIGRRKSVWWAAVLWLVIVPAIVGCAAQPTSLPTLVLPAAAHTVHPSTEAAIPAGPSPVRQIKLPPTFTPPAAPETPTTVGAATTEPPAPSQPTQSPTTSVLATAVATYQPGTPQIAPDLPDPPTAVPTAVPTIEVSPQVTNILLLGNDVAEVQGGRTDTIIIVSINKDTKTANLLNLPRDLFVYIPQWTVNRINLALPHGHGSGYPGGGGALVADTILYNFGIPIDQYARVGFDGFKEAVDILGGVEIAVSCPLTDWRLSSPELDPNVKENYIYYRLEPGVYQMDADLALWYARSRMTTSDFDRNRRQQQILHAMLNRGLDLDLLPQAPQLWDAFQQNVETNMSFNQILQLAALAPAVRQNGIQHLNLPRAALRSWRVPSTGAAVQLLNWPAAESTLRQLIQPPLLYQATRPAITVEVVTGDETLYRLAADNLSWYGFAPRHVPTADPPPATSQITYHSTTLKGSFSWLLTWIFDRRESDVILDSAEPAAADYRVMLGQDYVPCRPQLETPNNPAP
jgi:polyisoprenyl-teichoic acid--peptidoglycan teichoic acid transferase